MSSGSLLHDLWPVLRRSSLRVALAALPCVAAVHLQHVANVARDRAVAEAAGVQQTLELADRAHAARVTYAARYAQLRARGRIGEGPRLALVETLHQTTAEMGLRHVTFELQPAVVTGQVETSRMTLQVGLVHEGELLRLFDRLSARAPTGLWVRRCTLQRSDGEKGEWQRGADNLAADCLLEWLTVRVQ